jgi:hypothetical protein
LGSIQNGSFFFSEVALKRLISRGKQGVSHCGLAIDIKRYSKTKEELWKLKYFIMQKYSLQKILSKKPKILQDIVTL